MNTKKIHFVAVFSSLLILSAAGAESVQGMTGLPLVKPKKTYSVSTKDQGEELLEQRGFGDQEPEVRMMNLMMVEGSGFEGMDMNDPAAKGAMKPVASSGHSAHAGSATETVKFVYESKIVPSPPKVGANLFTFRLLKAGAAVKGVPVKVRVTMTSMDMGTDEPKVKEAPDSYQTKVIFSMPGPWAVKVLTPGEEKVFLFDVGK